MWISPIEIIDEDIELRLEDTVFKAVQSVGIKVNKDELLKALAYDRGQYEKGYADGVEDAESKIVRCKDCKWFGDFGCAIKIVDDSDRPTENDFCSFAERKDE